METEGGSSLGPSCLHERGHPHLRVRNKRWGCSGADGSLGMVRRATSKCPPNLSPDTGESCDCGVEGDLPERHKGALYLILMLRGFGIGHVAGGSYYFMCLVITIASAPWRLPAIFSVTEAESHLRLWDFFFFLLTILGHSPSWSTRQLVTLRPSSGCGEE